MPRRSMTATKAAAGLIDWLEVQTANSGGSLTSKSYVSWYHQQDPKPPSATTVTKHLGSGTPWGTMIWAYRELVLVCAESLELPVELPVPCRARGSIKWAPCPLSRWGAEGFCICDGCDRPTLGEQYPELVSLLVDPEDARRMHDLHGLAWRVCVDPELNHPPAFGPATAVEQGLRCRVCHPPPLSPRELERQQFFTNYPPGSLAPARPGPVSRLEAPVAAALRDLRPQLTIDENTAVALPADAGYHHAWTLKPDLVLPDRRIAIEIDGGTGSSPAYSRHDRPEGAADDAWRDRLLQQLGWQVLRLRHPRALSLDDSPVRDRRDHQPKSAGSRPTAG